MTYRPLLERIGRGRFVGKIRGSKKDSTNNRSGTGDTLPLKAGAGAQGSHKLGNDGKGRGILRTTDMHVDVDEELGKMGGYSTHAGRF